MLKQTLLNTMESLVTHSQFYLFLLTRNRAPSKAKSHESSKMVGLSIVLEEHHHQQQRAEHRRHRNGTAEVISKTNMMNNPSTGTGSSSSSSAFLPAFPIADFLNQCFLCRAKLSPGKDIYMYRYN